MTKSGIPTTRTHLVIPLLLVGLLGSRAHAAGEGSTAPYEPPGVATTVAIELVPSAPVVQPGDPLTIDVVVSGLGAMASPSVGAFDLAITWDDTLFSYDSLTFGTGLGDPMTEAISGTTPMANSVQTFELSLLAASTLAASQPATFTLATLTFDSNGLPGEGAFDVGGTLSDENGVLLPFTSTGTQISTGTVLDIPTLSSSALLTLIIVLLASGMFFLRRIS